MRDSAGLAVASGLHKFARLYFLGNKQDRPRGTAVALIAAQRRPARSSRVVQSTTRSIASRAANLGSFRNARIAISAALLGIIAAALPKSPRRWRVLLLLAASGMILGDVAGWLRRSAQPSKYRADYAVKLFRLEDGIWTAAPGLTVAVAPKRSAWVIGVKELR